MYDQNVHLEIAQLAGNETLKNSLGHVFERIVLKRRTDGLYDAARGVNAHQQHLRAITSDGAAQCHGGGQLSSARTSAKEKRTCLLI